MPRTGGESGKLGDRYEAVWTVDSLLDVLEGSAQDIVVEPFDEQESLGVEFIKEAAEGTEFHSAKRQTTGSTWSIAEVTSLGKNGRSVLGDLFAKLALNPSNRVVFVSGTTARDLEELCEAATDSKTADVFKKRIESGSRKLRKEFESRLLKPQFDNDLTKAWHALRRIRVVGWNEREMIRRVDQRIRGTLYRTDGALFDETAVRCLLAEMLFTWFGQPIKQQAIIDYLASHDIAERDWSRPNGLRELIEKRNKAYIRHVEAELIANEHIAREEAADAFQALMHGGKERVLFIGTAGLGKSCTVVQTVIHLHREDVPTLALRLDLQTETLTSKRFGEELGLPESPVLTLAGIANGRRCVLVLDQLDAISFASGRNQQLWAVFEEMLLEAQRYPQMRLLLACRAFDAEHDPRLRKLFANEQNTVRINLGKLSPDTVKRLVQTKAGVDPVILDSTHLDLLRAPLHLSLYLQSNPQDHPRFSGVQELLGHYWKHKKRKVSEQLGRECRWFEIIETLVERLSRDQTLSALHTLLDPFEEAEIAAMASHNVIVVDGSSVRFFHEAFFDYCCARLFVEQEKTLLDLLLGGNREQHLFRRAQVRQILEYEREHNPAVYLRDLHGLLANTRVRFHLKKLALDWLGGLPNPMEQEWHLLQSLDTTTPIGWWAKRVAWGRPSWVLLLNKLGVWEQWLDSADVESANLAVRILSLTDVLKACSAEVAQLFRPYVEGLKAWREEFKALFYFSEGVQSDDIFELLRDATRLRLVEMPASDEWYVYERLAQAKPRLAVNLLAVFLELNWRGTEEDDEDETDGIGSNFITESARGAPEEFAQLVLPYIIKDLKSRYPDDSRAADSWKLTRHTTPRTRNTPAMLVNGLGIAMGFLARERPQVLDLLTEPAESIPHKSISKLLLSAWTENAPYYADKMVDYFVQDTGRLGLGYDMWTTGNGIAAIARASVRIASLHCSQSNYTRLEAAILEFKPEHERNRPKQLGYRRMLLLECLPPARITSKARLHFEELKRRFPWEKFEMGSTAFGSGFIGPPIPKEATDRMTDAQWIEAMHTYAADRMKSGGDFLKGGKNELASVLRGQAQVDKPRFAQLALRLDGTIAPEYFNAILSGISNTAQEVGAQQLPKSALEPLDPKVVEQVIAHIHAIGAPECARDICWAIRTLAQDHLPAHETIIIVCHYAMNDPDPEKEQWQEVSGGSPVWGGDPHFNGMNSVRGAAAEALGSVLFAGSSCFSEVEPAVLSVIHDRSIAVRSCALVCLVAMINFDQDRAVRLFLELCDGADPVLDTHYSEQFIYHATYRHYQSLRSVLLHMLKIEDEGARSIASRQITLAAFHDPLALEDLKQVLSGDDVCRREAAAIYAHNLGREASRVACRERLTVFFNDPSQAVRAKAAACFRLVPEALLAQEQALMLAFVESPGCVENSRDLTHVLKESTEPLPEVLCRFAERLIAEQKAHPDSHRGWFYDLPSLIARLYEQNLDPTIKSRCLDIIDGMLELGFGDVEKELAQVER